MMSPGLTGCEAFDSGLLLRVTRPSLMLLWTFALLASSRRELMNASSLNLSCRSGMLRLCKRKGLGETD